MYHVRRSVEAEGGIVVVKVDWFDDDPDEQGSMPFLVDVVPLAVARLDDVRPEMVDTALRDREAELTSQRARNAPAALASDVRATLGHGRAFRADGRSESLARRRERGA